MIWQQILWARVGNVTFIMNNNKWILRFRGLAEILSCWNLQPQQDGPGIFPIYVSVLADQLYVVNFWTCLEPCILYSPSLSVQDHFNFPGELRFLNSAPRFQVEEQECKHKRSLFFISRQIWCNSRVKVDGIVRLNVQGWIEIFFPPVQFAH